MPDRDVHTLRARLRPTQLLYHDVAAIRWITEVLGFREAIRFSIPGGAER